MREEGRSEDCGEGEGDDLAAIVHGGWSSLEKVHDDEEERWEEKGVEGVL